MPTVGSTRNLVINTLASPGWTMAEICYNGHNHALGVRLTDPQEQEFRSLLARAYGVVPGLGCGGGERCQ